MAKKNKILDIAMWIIGVIASIGIGELFISGTFLNGTILGFLPLIIHQIVGWALIGSAIITAFKKFTK